MNPIIVTPNIDWLSFELTCRNRGVKADEAFQELADQLFCREHGIKDGLRELYNNKHLETIPFEQEDKTVVGYQAKYYRTECVDSTKQKELLKALKGAKKTYEELIEIYFYLNRELSSSSVEGEYKTKA